MIIQSHPDVVSAIRETGKILYQSRWSAKGWALIRKSEIMMKLAAGLAGEKLISLFDTYKMKSLSHEDDKFKFENIAYLPEEVQNSIICLKSVNNDIWLNKLFYELYGECHFVGVVRNGYAMCESWIRRGYSATAAGAAYKIYVQKMLEDSKRYPQYTIIKFEDVLKNPFEASAKLFQSLQLDPATLPKIRFKSKKVLTESGAHDAAYGQEEHKYWFSPENIRGIIKEDIDDIQISKLKDQDKSAFEKEAYPALISMGYL
jgi:hypothetical protein